MKTLDLIISANTSLLRNKARTILTVIAIFIGAATLSLTSGIGSGIKAYLNKQVGNLGSSNSLTITALSQNTDTNATTDKLAKYEPGQKKITAAQGAPGSSQVALTEKDVTKIKAEHNITLVEPEVAIVPDYIASSTSPDKKYQFSIRQTFGTSSLDMSNGRSVSNKNDAYEVTIPSSYLSSLGFADAKAAINKMVTMGITDATGTQTTVQATIVGVQQKTLIGSSGTYGNSALTGKLYDLQSTGLPANAKTTYSTINAEVKSGLTDAQIVSVKSDLKTKGYDAKTIKDTVSTVFTIIDAITYVFDGFAAITLVAAGFGIINTLFMSVQERTKEIGLMKALGMGKRKIFMLFSIEAVLIGFWGSVLGVGFANVIGLVVNSIGSKGFLKNFTGLQLLSFPLKSVSIIVGGIMVIAFLAGTLPARRASKKDPIDALRYE